MNKIITHNIIQSNRFKRGEWDIVGQVYNGTLAECKAYLQGIYRAGNLTGNPPHAADWVMLNTGNTIEDLFELREVLQ